MTVLRTRLRRGKTLLSLLGPCARTSREHERRPEHEKRHGGQTGNDRKKEDETACNLQGFGNAEQLANELVAERRLGLFDAGHARDEHAGRRRQDQGRNLRHQTVADGEKPVASQCIDDRHATHRDPDGQAAQNIDDENDDGRDDVAFYEISSRRPWRRRTGSHAAGTRRRRLASPPSMLPAAKLRIDGHLLAGHRVEGAKRAATSAARSDPLAMTMNWIVVSTTNTTAPTT